MIRDYQAIQKTWFVKGRQKVIQTYGKHEGVKLLGILDYAKIHHAKLLTRFLQENPRLHLEFLPPYSPNLNIIEEL